jgi:uncharacterized protein (TIGR03083 family)
MTKADLLQNIRTERAALDDLIAQVGEARVSEPLLNDGWSVKDVLMHICTWEKIAVGLVRSNQPVDESAADQSGQDRTDAINQKVYEDNRHRPFTDIAAEAGRSHEALVALVEELSDEQLDGVLGGGDQGPTAGQILSGNGDQHYHEHIGWIREQLSL